MTDGDVHITFPQYSAVFKRIDAGDTVTIIISCPVCGKEVLRRSMLQIPEDQVIEMTKDARAQDRETYWDHVKQHITFFDQVAS